jgi:hypothetical protein
VDEKRPNLIERMNEAQQHVTAMFVHQCAFGEQTKRLPATMAACGQFVGAEAIPQRGLHGISAALRVLGPCSSKECKEIVAKIVSYCEALFGVNTGVQLDESLAVAEVDKNNVIKLGELLYGLSFVTTAQAEQDRLIRHIAKLLNDSFIGGKGWGYFLNDAQVELLPTAYALRGLAENGFDVTAARKFLLESLAAPSQSATSPADLTTAVACTYCLTFYRNSSVEQDPLLRKAFLDVWSSLEPILEEDIEQNLEYWGDGTYYVRIPWQLYLLALASEYSRWRFAGFRAQQCLNRVVDALRRDSFKYAYSGTYLSSRTNSVAFEVLVAIRERVRYLLWIRIANVIDSARVFAGSRLVRRIAATLALGIILYSSWQWMQSVKLSELAPHFISGVIILLLAWGRR